MPKKEWLLEFNIVSFLSLTSDCGQSCKIRRAACSSRAAFCVSL